MTFESIDLDQTGRIVREAAAFLAVHAKMNPMETVRQPISEVIRWRDEILRVSKNHGPGI